MTNLQEMQRIEECIKRHHMDTINKIQMVRNSTERMIQFFQKTNCKENKREKEAADKGH